MLPVGGGATTLPDGSQAWSAISIHAPRGGSDGKDAQTPVGIFGENASILETKLRKSSAAPVLEPR